MFYDLNELIPSARVDTFSLEWVQYEIREISEKYKNMIQDIDTSKDIFSEWKPIIFWLLSDWNDSIPSMTEKNIGAIIPIIIRRINENNT